MGLGCVRCEEKDCAGGDVVLGHSIIIGAFIRLECFIQHESSCFLLRRGHPHHYSLFSCAAGSNISCSSSSQCMNE